jgi:predicted metal-binding membrane protein
MRARVNSQKPITILFVALVAMTWLCLLLWGQSPYGRFLGHGGMGTVRPEDFPLFAVTFVAGWTLMITAMMLPTSLPLVMLFHSVTAQRRDRVRLVALLVAGYIGIWAAFGAALHLGDELLHELTARIAWLGANSWVIGAGTLLLAGIYQFTPFKYRCLDKCRSPLSFIISHWQGRQAGKHAMLLGVHHGLFCIGCCWALMSLMFTVGAGNIGWMLALGTVMAVEKNMPWGRRLSMPLGMFLIGLAIMVGWGAASGVTLIAAHSHQ